jgi:hypothetical protein
MDYKDLLKQSMTYMPTADQLKGLLSPQQTRLQAGLLGASSGVLPLMGVRDRPVGLGEVLLAAGTGAQAGLQQKQQSDLASALQGLNIASTLKDLSKPTALDLSNAGKIAVDAGYIPGTPEYEQFVRDYALKPETQISMGDKEFDKRSVNYAFDELQSAGEIVKSSADLDARLEVFENLLNQGVETGYSQDILFGLKRVAADLGVLSSEELEGFNQQELIKALEAYLTPRMRVVGSGSTSDIEVDYMNKSVPGLGKDEESNRLIVAQLRTVNNYNKKRFQLMNQFVYKNQGLFDRETGEYFGDYADSVLGPMFQKPQNNEEFNFMIENGLIQPGQLFVNPQSDSLMIFDPKTMI